MSSTELLHGGIGSPPPYLNPERGRAASSSSSSSTFHGLKRCSNMRELKQYHSQIIRLGLSPDDNNASSRLIKFCALSKNGDFSYALKLFDTIPHPDAFLYNLIFKGYLLHIPPSSPFPHHHRRITLLLYSHMLQHSASPPNSFTFPSLARACGLTNNVEAAKQIHAHLFKFGFGADACCSNNLIHMYVSLGKLPEARRVFDAMPRRDSVSCTTMISGYSRWGFVDEAFSVFQLMMPLMRDSAPWNAMIAAFVQSNRFHEALALFHRMRDEKVGLDKFVAATVLSACTGLGALEQGKWVHELVAKNGIEVDRKLATAIIDMYCKCGSLDTALQVFRELPCKGISSWNSMIGGLAMHGKGQAAIELFKEMEREMVPPDDITFVNLLSACSHSGLVRDGQYYFRYMFEFHGIEPTAEHYGCMVDLLGRAGMLEEARKLVEDMPINPDEAILGALLGACKKHKNIELGEGIGRRVIELEPNNSGRYVALANLCANAGQWEDAVNVRKLMNDRKVRKSPGISAIELEGEVHEFIAGDHSHPQAREIYGKVDEMLEEIKSVGYVPETEGVLHEIEEEGEREKQLYYHSEKLAVALGLLKSKPGETLRIVKNLRICKDCHQACKLISKVFDRQIIVRDRNRFHHFTEGQCSCKEFW